MVRKAAKYEPRKIVLSGKGHDICMADYKLKPASKRKRGFGFQYTYDIDSREAEVAFIDHFLQKAADFADKEGAESPSYLQLCEDAKKF